MMDFCIVRKDSVEVRVRPVPGTSEFWCFPTRQMPNFHSIHLLSLLAPSTAQSRCQIMPSPQRLLESRLPEVHFPMRTTIVFVIGVV